MESFMDKLPGWFVTMLMGGMGVAVGWGILKAEVANLKMRMNEASEKLKGFVDKQTCAAVESSISEDLVLIKESIDENRRVVTKQFEEIREFMGYVKRVVENVDRK